MEQTSKKHVLLIHCLHNPDRSSLNNFSYFSLIGVHWLQIKSNLWLSVFSAFLLRNAFNTIVTGQSESKRASQPASPNSRIIIDLVSWLTPLRCSNYMLNLVVGQCYDQLANSHGHCFTICFSEFRILLLSLLRLYGLYFKFNERCMDLNLQTIDFNLQMRVIE